VERVYVHWSDPNKPALFGKVVFNRCSVPAIIMGRLEQAKFTVNSKPLWCKRFEVEKKGLSKKKEFQIINYLMFYYSPIIIIIIPDSCG